jgi:hypothetical protein
MASQLIPLTTAPNQTFQVALDVNNTIVRLTLTIRYNEMANYWVLTIADNNGNVLMDNIPLVTGSWPAANILDPYQYLGIGSAYVINASNAGVNDYPNATSLGTDFVLLWGDNAHS